MALQERLSNLGYLALSKETTAGTAVIPSIFVPLYKESITTDTMVDLNEQISGQPNKTYSIIQGQRDHKGGLTVLAEPTTAAQLFNMLVYKSGDTGSGDPYTHSFSGSSALDSASYTIDLLKGLHVFRYFGVKAEEIKPSFNKNKMQFELTVAALGSFSPRAIASVSGSGPYTVVLSTAYDAAPTTGLVTADIMQLYKQSDGTYTNFAIASIVDGVSFTTTTDLTSGTAGDIVSLRAQTPSFSLLAPFLWSNTKFCFGATASAALSAAHTPVEQGSAWDIKHSFNSKGGEHRSGSLDPASLARNTHDVSAKVKRFFDDPTEMQKYLSITAQALVIRHFSGSNHELRVTLNSIVPKSSPNPLDTGKLIYEESDYVAAYNTSDSQAYDVKVINASATV